MESTPTNTSDWRCRSCGKLLAKREGNLIHIEIGTRHRYVVDGKVTSICPRCETLNSEQTSKVPAVSK